MLTSFQQNSGYSKLIQSLGCVKPCLDWRSFAVRVILTSAVISFLSIFVLRHSKFVQMLATSSLVESSDLPITERGAYYCALRVYLQMAQWMNLDLRCLDTTKWGWNLENEYLVPIKADIDPASEFLLNFIRCKCKTTTKNPYGTTHCPCPKHGLKFVAACGGCRGELCNNMVTEDYIVDEGKQLDRIIFDLFD